MHASLPENGVVAAVRGLSSALIRHDIGDSKTVGSRDAFAVRGDFQLPFAVGVLGFCVGNPILSFKRLNVVQAISVDAQRCHADVLDVCRVLRLVVYVGRAVYYIILLRIVFRTFGNGGISAIASLRAVRTAVCFVARRSRCGILILGRLCLGLRRSGISGSFGGVYFNGSGIYHGTVFVHERQRYDVLIAGQRPAARAHGQHHDSRKSSCEQAFARILFKHMECLLSQRAC